MITQTFTTKLKYYLDACYSLLGIETHEESRAVTEIRQVVADRNKGIKDPAAAIKYWEWDCASGLSCCDNNGNFMVIDKTKEPIAVLSHISAVSEGGGVFVLKDMHPFWKNDAVCRKLRNLVIELRSKRKTILLLSPRINLPVELLKDVQLVDYALPDEEALDKLLNHTVSNIQDKHPKFTATPEQRAAVVAAARGMTSVEADNAFSLCTIIVSKEKGKPSFNGDFPRLVFEEKIVNLKNSFLEYLPVKMGFDAIGGMTELKKWSRERRAGFEAPAREAHLPYPRGCLLTGFAGTGKTVMAMAIANEFQFPLFKLDIGKIFGSKVGESEANTRELIRLLEGLGRAVILIDEMEKSLNESAVSGVGDSGTSSRVFGTLLSWMALKTCPTFLIGTINNIELLPAALTRRGRFDEIWFADLPTADERLAIFNVLLEHKLKRQLKIEKGDGLIEATRDFTGSEIESVIEDSLYALLDDPKQMNDKLPATLLATARGMVPQARLNPDQVKRMRDTAAKGFRLTGIPVQEIRAALAHSRDLAISN